MPTMAGVTRPPQGSSNRRNLDAMLDYKLSRHQIKVNMLNKLS